MAGRRYPISAEAIAAADRFIKTGARAYTHAGEPAHPSLRQIAAHLVVLELAAPGLAAATLARALARAGVELPPHWRRGGKRTSRKVDVNISRHDLRQDGPSSARKKPVVAQDSLCSSVEDGRPAPRPRHASPSHPWFRRPPVALGEAAR